MLTIITVAFLVALAIYVFFAVLHIFFRIALALFIFSLITGGATLWKNPADNAPPDAVMAIPVKQ